MSTATKRYMPVRLASAFRTPLGTLVGVASDRGLCAVSFDVDVLSEGLLGGHPVLELFRRWLEAYFEAKWDALPQLPLDIPKTPARDYWLAAQDIPIGSTATYGAIANELGRASAARAVGTAMAHNPLALVIPCHRVVAQNGSLTGYAGGIERKAWLLRHEGSLLF